jgi:DNA-binding transcriptional ArsR family regulator
MERLAAIFKALSDRNRLEIFQRIRSCCCGCGEADGIRSDACGEESSAGSQGAADGLASGDAGAPPADVGNSVSEIASQFDLSLSTVSHHLKELRNAGLIICEKRGQWVYCRPNPEVLKDIEGFLEDVES